MKIELNSFLQTSSFIPVTVLGISPILYFCEKGFILVL